MNDGMGRREAITLMAAGVLGAGATAAHVQNRGARMDQSKIRNGAGFYRFMFGPHEITVISDGGWPVGSPHPTTGANTTKDAVYNVLRTAHLDPEDAWSNCNTMLVRSGGRTLLIDGGCGDLFGDTAGFQLAHLEALGISPDDITDVFVTHMHPDHVGGLYPDGNARFRRARHTACSEEIDFWRNDPDLSKMPFVTLGNDPAGVIEGAQAAINAMMLTPNRNGSIDHGDEVIPGVRVAELHGHTPGHCGVELEHDGRRLRFIGDVATHHVLSFEHPEWYFQFDAQPDRAVETRRRLLSEAADRGDLLVATHISFPGVGTVQRKGEKFQWIPTTWKWTP
ncbi:MAG: MBL fold metallo-hydrolase [Planctomycetota bacterium]